MSQKLQLILNSAGPGFSAKGGLASGEELAVVFFTLLRDLDSNQDNMLQRHASYR